MTVQSNIETWLQLRTWIQTIFVTWQLSVTLDSIRNSWATAPRQITFRKSRLHVEQCACRPCGMGIIFREDKRIYLIVDTTQPHVALHAHFSFCLLIVRFAFALQPVLPPGRFWSMIAILSPKNLQGRRIGKVQVHIHEFMRLLACLSYRSVCCICGDQVINELWNTLEPFKLSLTPPPLPPGPLCLANLKRHPTWFGP